MNKNGICWTKPRESDGGLKQKNCKFDIEAVESTCRTIYADNMK